MLRLKKRVVLILTAIVLTSAIIILKSYSGNLFKNTPQSLFINLTKPDIDKITILRNNNKIIVKKENGSWSVLDNKNKFSADTKKVNSVLDSVLSLRRTNIISNNRSKHLTFGIGNDYIELDSKDHKYTLYIANSNASIKEYFRYNNENEVYATDTLSDLFNYNDYKDLNIDLIKDEFNLINIQIITNTDSLELSKKNKDWYLDEKKIDNQKIDFFINDLKTLRSEDVSVETASNDSLSQYLEIKVQEDKNKKTISFYKSLNDSADFAKTSYNQYTYKILSANIETINKTREYFLSSGSPVE